MNRPILEIESLAGIDHDRLEVATSATKPLPASNIEECRELLTAPHKVSVNDHQTFRESLAPRPKLDPIDELVAELRRIKPEGGKAV